MSGEQVVTEGFQTPFTLNGGFLVKTTMELRVMAASEAIRSKKDWRRKLEDKEIVAKWEKESTDQGLKKEEFEYVYEELKYYSSLSDGPIQVSSIDGMWEADNLVGDELKSAFVKTVYDLLENVPQKEKDYHPWSNDLVLDLVHPSLYAFTYGVSRVTVGDAIPALQHIGSGIISPETNPNQPPELIFPLMERKIATAVKHQWLPAEFRVDPEGKVTIESYINNLHPIEHKALYPLIARIFELFVPMFNRVLTDLKNRRPNRIQVTPYEWYGPCPAEPTDPDYQKQYEEWEKHHEEIWPKISKFEAPASPNNPIDLKGKTLQVIVKLANIELTPEKPKYDGGVWHVEGTWSEYIVASGIYYYDCDNLTESKLEFRQAIDYPEYEQYDEVGVREIYNLEDEGKLNQRLGAVTTIQDRMIAFPNIYQHRVAPFELADPKKPGHRKILVFFLVDPTKRIISTKTVPPQQRSWYLSILRETKPFGDLPLEVVEHIVRFVDWPMNLKDAKKHREDLMNERKIIRNEDENEIYDRYFSLCEH